MKVKPKLAKTSSKLRSLSKPSFQDTLNWFLSKIRLRNNRITYFTQHPFDNTPYTLEIYNMCNNNNVPSYFTGETDKSSYKTKTHYCAGNCEWKVIQRALHSSPFINRKYINLAFYKFIKTCLIFSFYKDYACNICLYQI